MPILATTDATWVNPTTVQYNAQELRRSDSTTFAGTGAAFAVQGGIVRHGDQSLAVSINSSDLVTVQAGACVVPANSGTGNGCYRSALGAAASVALDARNATNPRIDLVVYRQLDTDVVATHTTYTARIEIITGTPAATPVAPALPLLAVELARINVPVSGGATAVVDSTYRTFSCSPEDVLPVPTAARLPASNSIWSMALALDTGILYRWDGTNWNPQSATSALVMASGMSDNNSRAYRRGTVAVVHIDVTLNVNKNYGDLLFTMPVGYRPIGTMYAVAKQYATASSAVVQFNPAGDVVLIEAATSGQRLMFQATLPL